jgi:hypothetical protein
LGAQQEGNGPAIRHSHIHGAYDFVGFGGLSRMLTAEGDECQEHGAASKKVHRRCGVFREITQQFSKKGLKGGRDEKFNSASTKSLKSLFVCERNFKK